MGIAQSARETLATRLKLIECYQVPNQVNDVGFLIADDNAARAEDATYFSHRVEVYLCIKRFFAHHAAKWTAGLQHLDALAAFGRSTTDILEHLSNRRAHCNFVKAGTRNLSAEAYQCRSRR